MVSFTDHYDVISIEDSHQKLILEKIYGTLIIPFYVRVFFFH